MTNIRQPTVAVIGLGSQGLVTVKNLLEEGYDVTGFDKNDYVGGIWHYSTEHQVSALPTTVVNISRERACFTDFPFPAGTRSHPDSGQYDKYLNDYADHFALRPHLRLGCEIKRLARNDHDGNWKITTKSVTGGHEETLEFDKLVMAVGPHSKPVIPSLLEEEKFAGEIMHSIAFKDPRHFRDKRVMVVGVSNTAADTSTSLVGIASKVYLSHRHGALVLPRLLKTGKSLDHALGYRQGIIRDILESYLPRASQLFLDNIVNKISKAEFGNLDPAWNLSPPPSLMHQVPTVSETLIPALQAGTIISTAAPLRATGPDTIGLQDGTSVQVDAIIFCTGYHLDLSLLGPHDPTLTSTGTHDYITPALYQNVFSLQYPDSLAIIGIAIIILPALLLSDLSSMAVAQTWSRKPNTPSLPPLAEMQDWYAAHLKWVASVRAQSPLNKFMKLSVNMGPWLEWVQKAAGTNVAQNLGYLSVEGWKFWWRDRELCGLLMDGIWSPHMYRLFESDRRKKWDGARAAILKVNEDVKRTLEQRKMTSVDISKQ